MKASHDAGMTTHRLTAVVGVALLLVAAGTLAACDQKRSDSSQPTASAPTSSPTQTPTASPTADPTASTTSGSGSASTACRSAHLTISLGAADGAAGSEIIPVVLTNRGTTSCTLQGWPGVSLVGHGDGRQIGAAADQDRSSPHPMLTLAPGASVHAPVKLTEALNYPKASCRPVAADGFRVYPPGETNALFVADKGATGCSSASVHLLTVQGLQAGKG